MFGLIKMVSNAFWGIFGGWLKMWFKSLGKQLLAAAILALIFYLIGHYT